jgi:hypothetical protein
MILTFPFTADDETIEVTVDYHPEIPPCRNGHPDSWHPGYPGEMDLVGPYTEEEQRLLVDNWVGLNEAAQAAFDRAMLARAEGRVS